MPAISRQNRKHYEITRARVNDLLSQLKVEVNTEYSKTAYEGDDQLQWHRNSLGMAIEPLAEILRCLRDWRR